jgi:hypothetical protein
MVCGRKKVQHGLICAKFSDLEHASFHAVLRKHLLIRFWQWIMELLYGGVL